MKKNLNLSLKSTGKTRKYIKESVNTPFVAISPTNHSILIKGKCCTEPGRFFNLVWRLLDEFYDKGNRIIDIRFHMQNIDGYSAWYICKLINKITAHDEIEEPVDVTWYYENGDFDALYQGKKIKHYTKVYMDFIPFH